MKAKTVVFVALCMWGGGITASSVRYRGTMVEEKEESGHCSEKRFHKF